MVTKVRKSNENYEYYVASFDFSFRASYILSAFKYWFSASSYSPSCLLHTPISAANGGRFALLGPEPGES